MATQRAADLYHAVVENDAERLAHLLENGGDVDEFFEDSMNISSKSLLHICCEKDHIECLRVLISHGALLDVRDKWGQTPLMYSVSIQFPENVELLLQASPDLCKCQDRYGKSSLHCAVEVRNSELIKMLLQFGADINLRNHDGFTPLMTSCARPSQDERLELDIVTLLIEHGALVDLYDYSGKRTALHIASAAGNFKLVKMLVAAGCDVNLITKTLRTPLTDAIYCGTRHGQVREDYMKIIECLVGAGADLGMSVCESCNPLLASAQVKCVPLMEFLLLNRADPNVKFPSGITAALVSTSVGDISAIRALISYNCDLTIQGCVYKRLYDKEFVIDPFLMALMQGSLHLCVLMILSGYPITKMWNTEKAQSCLHLVAPNFLANNTDDDDEKGDDDGVVASSSYNIEEISVQELCRSKCKESTLIWIRTMSTRARSLQAECVFAIRAAMGRSVGVDSSCLPVPKAVRDDICLKHVLELFDQL